MELIPQRPTTEVLPRLRTRRFGSGPRRLVLLHGFTGDANSFAPLEPALGAACSALCISLPGHGGSDRPAPGREGWELTLRALEALLAAEARPVELIGYSMGARIALALALRTPRLVSGLILISGTAGLRDEAERARRRADDESLARLLEEEGLPAFLSRWEETPLLAGLRLLPTTTAEALRRTRLAQDPRGLASALRVLGQGAQPPLWDSLAGLQMPALFLAGSNDAKYSAIAKELASARAGAPAAAVRLRNGARDGAPARAQLIPHSGHSPHLEAPQATAAALLDFLHREGADP